MCVYALNEGKITEVYAFNYKVEADYISGIKINGDELVFARFKVDEKKEKESHFDYFLGWIKKEAISIN